MTTHPEIRESRRMTLATCALVAACQLAFTVIDLRIFGTIAAGLDLGHALVAAATGLWLWRRGGSERAYQIVFAIVALLFVPVILFSELRGIQLGYPRDPLVPLQFVMTGVAVLAPGRASVGIAVLAAIAAAAIGLWIWLGVRGVPLGTYGEPWMTLVYAGVAASLLWLRIRRAAMMRELATTRAQAHALARVARLFLAARDEMNTPLQTLAFGTELLARRKKESEALVTRMDNALTRLRELSDLLAATEAWPHGNTGTTVDLAHEVEEAARELDRVFGRPSD